MVETPVLFITFVRPDYARLTWEGIKAAKPKSLYFYSNKGRIEKEGEIDCNNEIRSYVNEIDWECDLHTWFREETANVYDSLRGAIDWLFDNEEEGIVLEEDVVPTLAFFSFCDQMIEKYRNDLRVWHISGDNYFNLNPGGYDYCFTHYHWLFGWASWRNRWRSVDWEHTRIDDMVEQNIYSHFFKSKKQSDEIMGNIIRHREILERTKCWDFYFGMVCDQFNGVGIVPKQHLISNIGLSGTHHKQGGRTFVNIESKCMDPVYTIERHPPFVFADYEYDYLDYKNRISQTPLWKRVLMSLYKKVRK